jgi:cytochrome c556
MAQDVRLIRSPISIAGMVLTTISAVVFIVVLLGDLFGLHTNPYLGILFFLLLPALFVLGLLLIPLGAWVERRRRAAGKPPASVDWPRIDLNEPRQRTAAVIIFCLTMANIVIVSLGAYKGVEYMDSVGFCGQACHTPMKPELVAHQQGPHARISCVRCHVAPGAGSFVRSKLAGTRRLLAVSRGSYSRPIVAATEDLVASRDTCEQCHSPDRFRGDVTRRISEYADSEENTESVSTLHLHVGGIDRVGQTTGIHWHADPATVVEYIATDDQRQTIPWVRVTDASGVREYTIGTVSPDELARGERRRMECTDCHNRPSHAIPATPERAVDLAISRGEIPATLPFVRREAVKTLKEIYPSEESAIDAISRSLRDFYKAQPAPSAGAEGPEVGRAVLATQNIYRRSVFPEMNVTFGTYANNIGHIDAPGCFRCHDDEHVAKDGKKIGQDCETCHTIE